MSIGFFASLISVVVRLRLPPDAQWCPAAKLKI
jgi:hypothetical protein